jgi:hypothetical protein
MNETPSILDRLDLFMERFSERERKLLIIMVISVGTMFSVVFGVTAQRTLSDMQEEIAEKREALELLVQHRDEYRANAIRNATLRAQLANNTVRLSTFIEGKSGRASMGRPHEFRDNEFNMDGGVTMRSTTAEWNSAEPEQILRFLDSVESADELVYVRQVSVAPARRAEGLEFEVTLVTFDQDSILEAEEEE